MLMSISSKFFALKKIPMLGDITIGKLINEGIELDNITDQRVLLERTIRKNKDKIIPEIIDNFQYYLDKAEICIEQYKDLGIETLCYLDDDYPKGFKALKDPPIIIFFKGNKDLLNYPNSLAIIGTRHPTDFGKKIANETTEYFVNKNFNIVSGLAGGIDTCAHITALKNNGLTTAVLTDVNAIYPKSNIKLAEKILSKNGLIISENAPNTTIRGADFVKRDRLQTALSKAVFAIEAGIKSGTRHAVNTALNLNTQVFCPDLESLISDKKYHGDESEIQGILEWIKNNDVTPFRSKDFNEIFLSLLKIKNDKQNNAPLKQGYLEI